MTHQKLPVCGRRRSRLAGAASTPTTEAPGSASHAHVRSRVVLARSSAPGRRQSQTHGPKSRLAGSCLAWRAWHPQRNFFHRTGPRQAMLSTLSARATVTPITFTQWAPLSIGTVTCERPSFQRCPPRGGVWNRRIIQSPSIARASSCYGRLTCPTPSVDLALASAVSTE